MLAIGNRKVRRFNAGKKKFVYSKKVYKNPFFQRQRVGLARPNRRSSNKIKLMALAAITAILILFWLLFFSTLFKINQIEINGAGGNMAKEIEILARRIAEDRIIGKNNLLLYNSEELDRALNEKYYLQNLSVKKNLFHTLKITLTEKSQIAVWHEGDKYFYLDSEGKVINQVDPLNINSSSLPLIENLTGIEIEERQANTNQPALDYILALFNEFKDERHGFTLDRFILDQDINTIKIAALAGPKIYFNLAEKVADQAARLDLIIKEKLKNDFNAKEYIDLRYGNNIYIK